MFSSSSSNKSLIKRMPEYQHPARNEIICLHTEPFLKTATMACGGGGGGRLWGCKFDKKNNKIVFNKKLYLNLYLIFTL